MRILREGIYRLTNMVVHAKPRDKKKILNGVQSAYEWETPNMCLSRKVITVRMLLTLSFTVSCNGTESKDHKEAKVVLSGGILRRQGLIYSAKCV